MHDLDRLALLVDDVADDHPRTALPLLVWCRGPVAEAQLEVLTLDGDHPASVLLGASVPSDTAAVGVVTTGWSVPADDRVDRVPVRSTVLVAADGQVAGRLAGGGATAVPAAPAGGLVMDLLRRAIGCATDPPAAPLVELLACTWLAQLAVCHPEASWAELAEVHLALQVTPDRSANELVEVALEVADELGWAGMRRVVRTGGWPGVCQADVAAWLDDGAFARWTLGSFPPVADLLAAAVAGRDPATGERITGAVRAWGLR